MPPITNWKERSANLASLLRSAQAGGWLHPERADAPALEMLWADAECGRLDEPAFIRLTALVQQAVEMPYYTTGQASAWLGLNRFSVVAAIQTGRTRPIKLGHDLLLSHAQVVELHETRRFPVGEYKNREA